MCRLASTAESGAKKNNKKKIKAASSIHRAESAVVCHGLSTPAIDAAQNPPISILQRDLMSWRT